MPYLAMRRYHDIFHKKVSKAFQFERSKQRWSESHRSGFYKPKASRPRS